MKINKLYDSVSWLLLLIMCSSFLIFNETKLSTISVVICCGLLFCIMAYKNRGRIRIPITMFHLMVMLFALFCFLSSIWATNGVESRSKAISIVEILCCMTIVFWRYCDSESPIDILSVIMWSSVVVTLYSLYYYGISHFLAMASGSVRIGNDYANSNVIGMWAAISAILFIYFILNYGMKLKYIAVIMPIILVAFSQSRTAFLVLIIGIILVIFFRYRENKSFFKGVLRISAAVLIIVAIIFFISQFQVFSGLNGRIQSLIDYSQGKSVREGSVIQRELYIQAGWEQFLKTPILGVGIGNTSQITMAVTGHSTYLHNNFVELLASGGIIGFGIYYGIILYLIIKLTPFALKKDSFSDACLVILIIHTIADYGTVSYYNKGTYFILVGCFLQVYINYKSKKILDLNNNLS